jgi:hypothetical protein
MEHGLEKFVGGLDLPVVVDHVAVIAKTVAAGVADEDISCRFMCRRT